MRRWKRIAVHGTVFHDWAARADGPRVFATVWADDDGGARWHIIVCGTTVTRQQRARSVTSAKRAAERWVETFARELLIACGKESP